MEERDDCRREKSPYGPQGRPERGGPDRSVVDKTACDGRQTLLSLAFGLVAKLHGLHGIASQTEEAINGPCPAPGKADPDKPCGLTDALIRADDAADALAKRLMEIHEALGRPTG